MLKVLPGDSRPFVPVLHAALVVTCGQKIVYRLDQFQQSFDCRGQKYRERKQ